MKADRRARPIHRSDHTHLKVGPGFNGLQLFTVPWRDNWVRLAGVQRHHADPGEHRGAGSRRGSGPIAACHSGASCSALGSSVM
jgi:hypothetical protein